MADPIKVPLSILIEDFRVYPRRTVNTGHVEELVRVLRGGHSLPPPLIERNTRRIVDGIHRTRAHRRVSGPDALIEVEERRFASDRELVETAVGRNASQGLRLSQVDRTHSVLLLQGLGADIAAIAHTLHVTEARGEQLRTRVAIVEDDGHREVVAAKPIVWPSDPARPRVISMEQAEVHTGSGGLRPAQAVRQLLRELRVGLIDPHDPVIAGLLWQLHDLTEEIVPEPGGRGS